MPKTNVDFQIVLPSEVRPQLHNLKAGVKISSAQLAKAKETTSQARINIEPIELSLLLFDMLQMRSDHAELRIIPVSEKREVRISSGQA
jgi:hypothetical protein